MVNNREEQSQEWSLKRLDRTHIILVLMCTVLIGTLFGYSFYRIYLASLASGAYEVKGVVSFFYSIPAFFVLGVICTAFELRNMDRKKIFSKATNSAAYSLMFTAVVFLIELVIFSIIFAVNTNRSEGTEFFGQNLVFFIILFIVNILACFLAIESFTLVFYYGRIVISKIKAKKGNNKGFEEEQEEAKDRNYFRNQDKCVISIFCCFIINATVIFFMIFNLFVNFNVDQILLWAYVYLPITALGSGIFASFLMVNMRDSFNQNLKRSLISGGIAALLIFVFAVIVNFGFSFWLTEGNNPELNEYLMEYQIHGHNLPPDSHHIFGALASAFIFFLTAVLMTVTLTRKRISGKKSLVPKSALSKPQGFIEIGKQPPSHAQEKGICMICKLEIRPGQEIVACPHCGSTFHKKHFISWLRTHNDCPVCDRQLSPFEQRIIFHDE